MARIVLKGLWIGPRCCAALASGTPNHGATGLHMTHRHFGVPGSKSRLTYTGPTRAAAWSGGAIVGAIIASVIVLGFVVYEVSKIVAHARTTATSPPRTTGQGSRAP
jgi:hypothetical protein